MQPYHIRRGMLLVMVLFFASHGLGQMRSGKFGIGFSGSGYVNLGHYSSSATTTFGGGLSASYSAMEHLGLRTMFGYGQIGWNVGTQGFTTHLFSANFYVSGDLLPHSSINPFVFVGAGFIYFDPRRDDGLALINAGPLRYDVNYLAGGGVDFFVSEFVSITVSGEWALTNTNMLDAFGGNAPNDQYGRVNLEVRYYFFDQAFITKLLEAQRERSKK